MSIKCDFHCIKTEFQKIVNLLDTTSDDKDIPRFVHKNWIEFYDQSGRDYRVNKEIRIKTPMLRSYLRSFSDGYIFVKRYIAVTEPVTQKETKVLHLGTMHHLSTAFQKSVVYKLIM